MADFFQICHTDLQKKVGEKIPPNEMQQSFCARCRNEECSLSGWGNDLFGFRISTQAERLLNAVQADPTLSKYAQIVSADFKNMAQHAMRLEESARRNDWTVPEINVSDGQVEIDPAATAAVDNAIRAMARSQGQEEPDLPDEEDFDEAEDMMAYMDELEARELSLEEAEAELERQKAALEAERRLQAPPRPSRPKPPPQQRQQPQRPAKNTNVPAGGLMVGGGPPPPPPKPHDPWAPPANPPAHKVAVGAKIRMGSGKEETKE